MYRRMAARPGRATKEACVRLTRSALCRAAIVGAAGGLLVGALLSPSAAIAKVSDPSARLQAALGDRTAGSYLDDSGALVVTVTDEAAAATVRAAGAQPHFVARSGAALA